ncbi:MAG: alpha/beta hydrolase [Myxococcales bacterium]|nr:alpha/beta hydrolase [Myxococcales bacterium]
MPWNEDFVSHRYVQLEEVRLHVVEAGEGPLVVMLHGFPEFWYSWRFQIPVLVRQGYRVVAPDMRGYNLSDKPTEVRAYRVERLAADVAQLVERLGERKAAVVGHDWGGMVAWWFAMRHPERLSRLTILNSPHPEHQLAMMRSAEQVRKSSYMLYFQLPVLPERHLMRRGGAVLREMFRTDPEREGAFSEADIDRYVQAMSGGTTRAALNYYRALLRRSPFGLRRALRRVDAPVQVIWGVRDRHIGMEYGRPSAHLAPDLRFDPIDDASHWVQVDRPAQVNARLKEFLDPLGPSRG